MDATPRFRLFDNTRRESIARDEEAGRALPRRRMLTSVSVARQRRRNRRRPSPARRGLALVPRLLSLSRSPGAQRRALLLLLLASCGTGVFVSARLFGWAAASSSSSWPPSPGAFSLDGAVAENSGDEAERPQQHPKRRRPAVSLGPDAIPSVVLVERRPSPPPPSAADASGPAARPGGGRKASSLDTGELPGSETEEGREEKDNPYRCRNTVQGMTLIADSEGRVCRRTELDDVHRSGCCLAVRPSTLPGANGGGGGLAGGAASINSPLSAAPQVTTRTEMGGGRSGEGTTEEIGLELVASSPVVTRGGSGGFPPEQALSTPFSCWSCDVGGDSGTAKGSSGGSFSSCCRSYEFCVACCQDPGRAEEREAIRAAAALSAHPAYRELGSVRGGGIANGKGLPRQLRASAAEGQTGEERENEDREAREVAFAHCAFRCRTYSGSVAHENSYRGPLKHCFGRFRPPAAAAAAAVATAAGMSTVGAQGRALPGAGGEVVTGGVGQGAPPLQLDPFLVGWGAA